MIREEVAKYFGLTPYNIDEDDYSIIFNIRIGERLLWPKTFDFDPHILNTVTNLNHNYAFLKSGNLMSLCKLPMYKKKGLRNYFIDGTKVGVSSNIHPNLRNVFFCNGFEDLKPFFDSCGIAFWEGNFHG